MPLFRRPIRLPAPVVARLDGASPIASSPLAGGGWVVLTAAEWIVVPDDDDGAVARHGWHEVDNAQWVTEASTLVVRWIDGTTERLRLAGEDERVPQVVRERVEASIVHVAQRDLPGGIQVRAVVRRDGRGDLSSQVSVVGTASVSPEVAELAAQLEAEVRAAVGLAE